MNLEFEWDERKAERNKNKHGVHFQQILAVFFDPLRLEKEDTSHPQEERYQLIGTAHGLPFFIVYTWRQDKIRIISARKATTHEQRAYYHN